MEIDYEIYSSQNGTSKLRKNAILIRGTFCPQNDARKPRVNLSCLDMVQNDSDNKNA